MNFYLVLHKITMQFNINNRQTSYDSVTESSEVVTSAILTDRWLISAWRDRYKTLLHKWIAVWKISNKNLTLIRLVNKYITLIILKEYNEKYLMWIIYTANDILIFVFLELHNPWEIFGPSFSNRIQPWSLTDLK